MRTIFVILMIALLPLRMWAAEGMAIRMAAIPVATSGASDAGTTHSMDDMPLDCPMRAALQHHEPSTPKALSASTCMACSLSAALVGPHEFLAFGEAPPLGFTAALPMRFDSADPLPALKPPIS